jgi:nicotinamidase-related amidase
MIAVDVEMIGLLVIDMINAFVEDESPLCVEGAKDTVPIIKKVVDACREHDVKVVFITRGYRADGSDVEVSRWKYWVESKRPLTIGLTGKLSGEFYGPLKPQEGDYVIVKKKWSAFFRTELDLLLRRLRIDTVVLCGTQTPNCVRAAAFEADENDFEVIILSDATSSKTSDVQASNLRDMRDTGFQVMSAAEFIKDIEELNSRKSSVEHLREFIEASRKKSV